MRLNQNRPTLYNSNIKTIIQRQFLYFFLNKTIDITKPLGCRWVDKHIHGGWGCMLDDALAAFYASIVVLAVRFGKVVEFVADLF
jgi:phosphatidylglycerophosphatase A